MRKGQINWIVYAVIVIFALIILAILLYKTGQIGTAPIVGLEGAIPIE